MKRKKARIPKAYLKRLMPLFLEIFLSGDDIVEWVPEGARQRRKRSRTPRSRLSASRS
jgi:hypothetical protein